MATATMRGPTLMALRPLRFWRKYSLQSARPIFFSYNPGSLFVRGNSVGLGGDDAIFGKAMTRVPISMEVGAKNFGPEMVGDAPELRNYLVAAGLNSIGILTDGGVGKLLAHWIAEGRPHTDVTGISTHYPNYAMKTARHVKRTPLYDRL